MNQIRRSLFFPALFILAMTAFQASAQDRDRDRDSRSDRENDAYAREHSESHGGDHRGDDGNGSRVPLDGGISLLLAAGIGLGVKKAIQRKNAAKIEKNETL